MEQMTPKPAIGLTSLDDAMLNQNTSGKPVKTFVGINSGSRTFSLIMSLFEIQEFTDVANDQSEEEGVAQRKLDIAHATGIARYILKGLLFAARRTRENLGRTTSAEMIEMIKVMGEQPYIAIPPLVASFRNCEPNGTNVKVIRLLDGDETASFKIFLNHGDVFWVVDGQHRRKGVQLVYEFLDSIRTNKRYPGQRSLYPDKTKRDLTNAELSVWEDVFAETKKCTLTLEVHLGLDIDMERQLFHDLNNLAKKVEKSLAFQFDGSNPINAYVKEELRAGIFDEYGYEVSMSDKVNWNDPGSGLTWKDLLAINAILFLNRTTVHGAKPLDVESRKDMANTYWSTIPDLKDTTDRDAKQKTVLAQPVVLKALAKLWYDFHWGKNSEWNTPENRKKLIEGIHAVDFSHENPMWRYYQIGDEERASLGLIGLSEYVPSEKEGVNRDIGMYDTHIKAFRFGAKHNDIFPIIGDMVRWKLGLPKRHKAAQLELQPA